MTRPSKRELERQVEELKESGGGPTRTTVLNDYDPEVRDFVRGVATDMIRMRYRSDYATDEQRPRTLAYLADIRRRYDVEGDRDKAAYRFLERSTRDMPHTAADDPLAPFVVQWPAAFAEADREKWYSHFAEGERAAAAGMMVSEAYHALADRGVGP